MGILRELKEEDIVQLIEIDDVCHDKLISIIMKAIYDGELVSLIRKYLVSGVMGNGVVSPTKIGTLQGGNLSPLLSNIMLNELDK